MLARSVLAIGEVLWDVLPDGERLGGAPANVAFHLTQAGHRVQLASAVGADALGERAVRMLAAAGIDTSLVATGADHATGSVRVELDASGVPAYYIEEEVAWDHIPLGEGLLRAARSADAIVFGTLAQRSSRSRETIREVLDAGAGALRVLDLNLRAPHASDAVSRSSMERADVLKLSHEEEWALGIAADASAETRVQLLGQCAQQYRLRSIFVTRGADGAEYLGDHGIVRTPSPPVQVADTVGAGDAFTAAMIDGLFRELAPEVILHNANAAGAHVASHRGAMVPWSDELRSLMGLSSTIGG
jgi:fructokinase